jgi:hypothetical protein
MAMDVDAAEPPATTVSSTSQPFAVQLAADEIAADMLLLDASTAAHTAAAAAAAAAAVTDADVTEEADVSEAAVSETDDDENSAQHLTFLFAALEEPALIEALQSTPALGKSISRMLPFLTYRRAAAAQALAAKFMEVCDIPWKFSRNNLSRFSIKKRLYTRVHGSQLVHATVRGATCSWPVRYTA